MAIFPTAVFFKQKKKEKKKANAITFIVVYIFNTGRFEIMSFNVESQFPNVSLSYFHVFLNLLLLELIYQHLQNFDCINIIKMSFPLIM